MNYTNINSQTKNKFFDRDNYFVVKNFCDPQLLVCDPINNKGLFNFFDKSYNNFHHDVNGEQVSGSTERYNYPKYKQLHYQLGLKITDIIGKKVIPTYFFDRFYFVGQELTAHTDRPACEISVSIHISTNLNEPWFFQIETPYDENHKIPCDPGDGIIYRGCDAKHWRDPLPSRYNKVQRIIRKLLGKKDDTYYHQIFFHYVLADGHRVQYAFDACK